MLVTGSIWAQGLLGPLVGVGRADARLVPGRVPALRVYYPLRFSIEDPERQARYASVFAIIAGAFVPLNFMAVRLAETFTHPRVLSQTGGAMPGEMRLTFLVALAGHGAAVRDAVEVRADRQARARCNARRDWPRQATATALMPALPLDEAGKYVAAAYLVFLALILIYVAIIGAQDRAHRSRRSAELRGGRRVTGELLTLGAIAQDRAARRCASGWRCSDGRAARVLARARRRTRRCTRPWRSPPATAPSSTSSGRPGGGRDRGARRCSRAQAGLRPTELLGAIYSLRGCDAVEHLFAVTSGLDSMIVGEAEVQGQVKRAYERALVAGTTGPITNRLFRAALATGKRVRTETGVSAVAACPCPRWR